MARRQTPKREAVATADDREGKRTAPAVAEADVARRAYDLYLARGREDGHDVEDWLQAERELGGTSQK
jgi:hypothetical protein